MKLHELCDILQTYCHCGYAQDEVAVLDTNGNLLAVPIKVELKRDCEKEIIAIEMHHKE